MEPLTQTLSYDGESDFTGSISVRIATINATVGLAWIAETFADGASVLVEVTVTVTETAMITSKLSSFYFVLSV